MSIKLMTQIWDDGPQNQTERFVLLALADYANDTGQCWPSVTRIAERTCLSERGIQKIFKRLCENGWLEIDRNAGPNNCNLYVVKTPNTVHPRTTFTPNLSAQTPNLSAQTPEPRSPKPLRTVKEPPIYNKRAREEVVDLLSQWASREASESFVKYRRTHKSKSLSVTGAKRLANHLQEIFNAGHDPSDALGMAEERGWASVELNWYVKKGSVNDRTYNGQRAAMGEDPAIDQITRVVGALQASREYRN